MSHDHDSWLEDAVVHLPDGSVDAGLSTLLPLSALESDIENVLHVLICNKYSNNMFNSLTFVMLITENL